MLQQLFGRVVVTDTIAEEFGLPLPGWVTVQAPLDVRQLQILELSLNRGEASAIALALENTSCLLIIDELQGRKLAQQLRLTITGTLGIIVQAKQEGYIPAVKPLLDLISETNFRLSASLVGIILKQAGE